jgi:hypothetical protein
MNATAEGIATSQLPAYSHFAALNALVDTGWLGVLGKLELAVWLVYARHADGDGIAFPGPRKIANALQHVQVRHVRRARKRLLELGLLSILRAGGGRHCAKIQVHVPPTPPRLRPRRTLGPNAPRQVGRNAPPPPPRLCLTTPPPIGETKD